MTALASDGYGGEANCRVGVTVQAPPPPPKPTVREFALGGFHSGRARLDNRMKAVLDDVALLLRQDPGATASITGHSDSRGSEQRNEEMALERAEIAKAYLVETHGIAASQISTRSAGSRDPLASNETRDGREQNRRVAIVVTIPPHR